MKTRNLLIIIFLLTISISGTAQEVSLFFENADAFFGQYVKDGRVDYDKIHANPDKLDNVLDLANKYTVSIDNPAVYKAFWINAYNLLVIKGVVNHYPINSPLDVSGFFDKITYPIGGKNRTLNEIENKILRSNFPNEARFHFALVCAGLGCPPIINKAYLPSTLGTQLQRQTVFSLNNPKFIRIQESKVELSQIFEWYEDDFKRNGRNFVEFINAYRKEKIDTNLEVSFYPYDWSLNRIE